MILAFAFESIKSVCPIENNGTIRKIKTYPTKEAILERFRLAPEQPCKNKFILDYIANWSIKKVKKGFEWKFDDTLFEKLQPARLDPNLNKDPERLLTPEEEKPFRSSLGM